MSWSFGVTQVDKNTVDEALNSAAETHVVNAMRGDSGPEMSEQMEQAVYAVVAIVTSGVLGEGPFSVSLSGHANPGHKPREGWADDAISINLMALRNGGKS